MFEQEDFEKVTLYFVFISDQTDFSNNCVARRWLKMIKDTQHFFFISQPYLSDFRSKMPKEIFETTVERAEGENWGLVVSGGKDMVNFTIISLTIISNIFTFTCKPMKSSKKLRLSRYKCLGKRNSEDQSLGWKSNDNII